MFPGLSSLQFHPGRILANDFGSTGGFPEWKIAGLVSDHREESEKSFSLIWKMRQDWKMRPDWKCVSMLVCFYFSRKRRMIETIIGHNQSSHSLPDDGQVKWRVVYVVKLRFIYFWCNLVSPHLVMLRTSLLVDSLVYKRTKCLTLHQTKILKLACCTEIHFPCKRKEQNMFFKESFSYFLHITHYWGWIKGELSPLKP